MKTGREFNCCVLISGELYVYIFRHYMMGEALDDRVHDAVSTAIVELKKETGPFDPAGYINFIVGNILTGLCFGGK